MIKEQRKKYSHQPIQVCHSLVQNKKRKSQINTENQSLLHRLMSTSSHYPKRQWEKHARSYFTLKQNLRSNNHKQNVMNKLERQFHEKNQPLDTLFYKMVNSKLVGHDKSRHTPMQTIP